MRRKLLMLPGFLFALQLQAQVYKADTAFSTDNGAGGAKASCISKPNGTNYGINQSRTASFLIGEDFTVPAGATWNLDTVIIYAYQTGSTTTSPITGATLQIRQGSVTGTSVFGDTTTNRMVNTSFTGIYRVDTGSPGLLATNRPLMRVKIKLTPTKSLTAGTYWLIWGCTGGGMPLTGPWCPPKVLPGRINPTGQNGMQRTTNGWQASEDSLSVAQQQNLGFNYILKGPQIAGGGGGVGIEEPDMASVILEQNVPNPVSGQTTIAFTLQQPQNVKLSVYTSTGQHVRTLVDKKMAAGRNEASFDVRSLAAGMYYYRLQTDSGVRTMKLEVLK